MDGEAHKASGIKGGRREEQTAGMICSFLFTYHQLHLINKRHAESTFEANEMHAPP